MLGVKTGQTSDEKIAKLHSIGVEFYCKPGDKTDAIDAYLNKFPPPLTPTVRKRLCDVAGCGRKARDNGKCGFKHGGYNFCKEEGCKNISVSAKRRCMRHGGFGWCKNGKCSNPAAMDMDGLCQKHYPHRICKDPNCNAIIGKKGIEFCLKHHPGLQYCQEIKESRR